ncbi:MAG: hypothetical protein ABSG43_30680, partial [Solirubrobacteraceae bacterium]
GASATHVLQSKRPSILPFLDGKQREVSAGAILTFPTKVHWARISAQLIDKSDFMIIFLLTSSDATVYLTIS